MWKLVERLYPICRSITGAGVRRSLADLQEIIPLRIHEVPTGTEVFDWVIPREWVINGAFVEDSRGTRILDLEDSNLHVFSYSSPVDRRIGLEELKAHIHTLPNHPSWIPYRTTYYDEQWGLCMTHEQLGSLEDQEYHVKIDSELRHGSLTYGELLIEGETTDEVLLSCYCCHPSMCNDNLSGMVVLAFLAHELSSRQLRYGYRFLFIPETIGAIAWLSRNQNGVSRIRHGLVATCLGDAGKMTYKRSRQGNATIDRVVAKVLLDSDEPHEIVKFTPLGSDERQFCSPGFDLPIGSLMRTPYYQFPEYHTSADNLGFISPDALEDSLMKYLQVVDVLEGNATYTSTNPNCEPNLGRRGLYRKQGGDRVKEVEVAMLWVLNYSDGSNSLLDIAELSKLKFCEVKAAADLLVAQELLKAA